jgi:hypothetical protein
VRIEKYPHPYRAWLTVSNDPDVTDIRTWHAWNDFLFKDLQLPWANAAFLFSFNQNLPAQVSIRDYPEIAAQPIDGLHTWGDFVHAGEVGFSRRYAEEGIGMLERYGIHPKVWVDHSRFTGNMLHNNKWGSVPSYRDNAGIDYEVFEYTLDLVVKAGIRYVWDGEITQVIGQDRDIRTHERFEGSPLLKRILQTIRAIVRNPAREWRGYTAKTGNSAYFRHRFPDGRELYCFRRYGTWRDADILGISNVISQANIDRLIDKRGVMVAYTHLGKTNFRYKGEDIIPPETRKCFRYAKKKMEDGSLKISSLSHLLDYLVLRDHVRIEGDRVDFRSDGIRFDRLSREDLASFDFSFRGVRHPDRLRVSLDGTAIEAKVTENGNGVITLSFRP